MGGYNRSLEGKSKVDVDLDGDGTVDFGANAGSIKEYFVEFNKSGYMMDGVLQESENVNFYQVDGNDSSQPDFSKSLGSESTYDGVTTIFAADGSNLGQKSSIDLAEAAKDANSGISKVTDFTGLPASFKAASGDTYVRVRAGDAAMGQQGSDSTYMDASGKVLSGYANSNSYSYDDGSGKTVTNTSVNHSSADWHPLGGTQIDAHSIRSNIIEVIDNSDNSNDVDLTPADTGNAKEITFKGFDPC